MALAIKVVTGEAIIAHPYIFNPRSESAEIDPGKYTGMVIIKKSDKETVACAVCCSSMAPREQEDGQVD